MPKIGSVVNTGLTDFWVLFITKNMSTSTPQWQFLKTGSTGLQKLSMTWNVITLNKETLLVGCGPEVEPSSCYLKIIIAGSIPLVCMSKCPWAKTEPQTSPDVLLSTSHGSPCHQCMNVCMNYCQCHWANMSAKCSKCIHISPHYSFFKDKLQLQTILTLTLQVIDGSELA